MKTFKVILIAVLIVESIGLICAKAESNYDKAIFYATNTDGSDLAIEQEMHKFGFDVDAYDCSEPSMLTKVIALTK